jgi:hypothetical protein
MQSSAHSDPASEQCWHPDIECLATTGITCASAGRDAQDAIWPLHLDRRCVQAQGAAGHLQKPRLLSRGLCGLSSTGKRGASALLGTDHGGA